MSLGTLSTLEGATTEAVATPVEEARTYVQAQASAHLDETGWRAGKKRAWLWVAVTTWVTVCVVRLSRGGPVARELLGEAFDGILVTERWSAYNWYPVRWRQLHMLRIREGKASTITGVLARLAAEAERAQQHKPDDGATERPSRTGRAPAVCGTWVETA